MIPNRDDDNAIYIVVVNHEQQYSIWPSGRPLAPGWDSAGKTGRKNECLDYISSVWTDMRPLSLRRELDELARITAADQEDRANSAAPPIAGTCLVERLSAGRHAVTADLQPETTVALRECVDREYVHVRFEHTNGGTTLGIKLDKPACVTHNANFENATGSIHLEGELTLNGTRVRCICDLDLATLSGEGCLVRVNA